MSVRFEAKPEVAYVVGLIHRLHHRANQHRLQQMMVGAIGNLLQHRLIVARRRLEATTHMQPHLAQELF